MEWTFSSQEVEHSGNDVDSQPNPEDDTAASYDKKEGPFHQPEDEIFNCVHFSRARACLEMVSLIFPLNIPASHGSSARIIMSLCPTSIVPLML